MSTAYALNDFVGSRPALDRGDRNKCEHLFEGGGMCGQKLAASNTSPINRPRCNKHNTYPENKDGTYRYQR